MARTGLLYPVLYSCVMRSSEMSLMSGTIKFKFRNLFVKALRELLCFAENLIKVFKHTINKIQKGIFYYNWIYQTYNDSFHLITSHTPMCVQLYPFNWLVLEKNVCPIAIAR